MLNMGNALAAHKHDGPLHCLEIILTAPKVGTKPITKRIKTAKRRFPFLVGSHKHCPPLLPPNRNPFAPRGQ